MPSINSFSAERAGDVQILPSFQIPRGQGLQLRSLESAGIDPAIQAYEGILNISEPLVNFDGMNNVNAVLPPDPIGDVGPDHYVQMINVSFAIYSKNGTLLYGPANINTLFTGLGGVCETTNRGDPVVLYDDMANRWLMSAFAWADNGTDPVGPYHQCIAISETSDPLGSWYRYDFIISNTKINDYPKFGVWPDGYYLAVNQFTQPTFNWGGQGVAVFERDQMLVGGSAQMVYFDMHEVDATLGAMLPSDADGTAPPANTPNYYMQFDDDAWGYSDDQLQVWEFAVDWDTPGNSTFTKQGELSTFAFDSNLCGYARDCIPQQGTTQGVDAISDRLMYRLQYRNFGTHESMVVNHTVDVGSDVAGIRWYELRDTGSGWSIYQQGTYSPDSTNRWMGSIAMDDKGNIALGYSASSEIEHPSIRYVGRLADDPLGTMSFNEEVMHFGGGAQTHSSARWGDYSMMAVDPEDSCSFWYTTEYYETDSSFSFNTRIGNFKFGDCDPFESGWLNLGDGGHANGPLTNGSNTIVKDIAVDDDGNIYVVGWFQNAGGIPEADHIAMWNGTSWVALGSNGSGDGAIGSVVGIHAIVIDDDGNIIVGGDFSLSGQGQGDIAMWNGSTWVGHDINGTVGGEINNLIFDASGNLYAGGDFSHAGGDTEAAKLAVWDGANWSPVGSVGGNSAFGNGEVNDLAFDSTGNLYVGGDFFTAGGNTEAHYIAMWDGDSWENLGCCKPGGGFVVNQIVNAIAIDSSDRVYIGGRFTNVAGDPEIDYIAMWDGGQWNSLGNNGAGNGALSFWVEALEFNGSYLFVGGRFQNAAQAKGHYLSVWTGAVWGYVSEESSGVSPFDEAVTAIGFKINGNVVEGTIAGGEFINLGGNVLADHIAYYENSTFADVPEHHSFYPYIQALYDAGFTAGCQTGPLLYCPDTILDRAQSAVFILRGQLGTGYTPPGEPWDTFQDDWSLSDISWAEKWAEGMWDEGLTAGCISSPLQYCPRSTLPRVEAAVFGLRLLHGSSYVPPDPTGALFADMTDTDYWGLKWAEQAYLDGLLPACGFTSSQPLFCPLDDVSRAWAAYMIVIAKSLPLP